MKNVHNFLWPMNIESVIGLKPTQRIPTVIFSGMQSASTAPIALPRLLTILKQVVVILTK
ncbi:hypothetical protein CHH28_17430 [Bacterioplanes sanyensis]|uniref:Uncharacterized protein n=1 Tax=Bacterioplanes sanyensis TaxID=1249553 RepID=A0A222FMU6_9GAMM|nr:hypothetical protein CHH28_17430 [Bacterioplanes sanyensis]